MSVNRLLTSKLEENPKSAYISSITICLKLLENIINYPKEEKFKRIKKSNPKISSELLIIDGIEDLFKEFGFDVDENEIILRRGGLGVISKLKTYRDFLQKRLELMRNDSAVNDIIETSSAIKTLQVTPQSDQNITSKRIVASKPFHERIKFKRVLKTQNRFLIELEQLSDLIMQYEDEELKKSALEIIPIEKLKLNAIENLRKFQKLIKEKAITDDEPSLDDFILEELASWFKNDFFTWVNNMDCKACKGSTQPCETGISGGVRVEQYFCNKCNVTTEFYRYNDIGKLLVTRSGRCGEFANCFTFLCRCLGYDARYIYCTSDHVWTEVYNHTKKRFIHVDPSENVFDSPLMYEHGWKKNIDYVIAFSCDDVQDVTWRYSNQHNELFKKRKICTESDLISAIIELRTKRQLNVSQARRNFLKMRTIAELAELMIIREPNENEKKGRSSGSLSWRLERGEVTVATNHIFKPSPVDIKYKEFNLRYSCAKNKYEKFISENVTESVEDWKTWEFKSENIFRKTEHDHKMVYLSRKEDHDFGMIEWKFDFGDSTVKSVELKFDMTTFQSGKLELSFKDQNGQVLGNKNDLIGKSGFSIVATLTGGNGDVKWQHAQLFRQKLNSDEYPFQLFVKFD